MEDSKKIVVIGSSNIDFIMKMDRLPRVGETITDAVYMQTFGGKGANQAVGAARAGGDVYFINCVGDDDITPRMLEGFRKDGIHTDYIFHETGISSGTALVMIGEGGANYLSVSPGANYRLTPAYIDRALQVIQEAGIILLQYEIPVETICYILDLCRKLQKKVMWNFAPARTFDISYLNRVEYLVVNETEAEILSGIPVADESSAISAARKLHALGSQNILITLGKNGSFLLNHENELIINAFPVESVDTTAAGDIFCGTLAAAIVEGKPLAEAVRFASAAAAISVTRMGAQPSAPSRAEIDEFLRGK